MIRLIGMTIIDWGNYVKIVETYTGRSPTKTIDILNIPPASPEAFLSSFKELRKDNQYLPRHLYYTFVCSLDQGSFFDLLLMNRDLEISLSDFSDREEKFFILSGGVGELGELLTTFTTIHIRKNLRSFLNEMFLILENLSIREIFSSYRKKLLPDSTFILERKS